MRGTYGDVVAVPREALHPVVRLDVPYAHEAVLPPTRQIPPVWADGEGPYFVGVPLHVLSLSLSVVRAVLVECVYLPFGV